MNRSDWRRYDRDLIKRLLKVKNLGIRATKKEIKSLDFKVTQKNILRFLTKNLRERVEDVK